ncbi:MAG: CPCC family cysteine-rich protein [Sedimentibacter saalensis]|uniref:CPCC family cysteine-rich protein n=1 Tax=Sedimentibacter saalensis TaxID=130788 RepID=UPI003157FA05
MKKYTCPCCGYKTLDDEHEYDICPVCYWEDDYLQFENVDLKSGANNGISLRQAQKNFIEFGACERDMIMYVRKPNIHDVRDKNWKPLYKEK